MEKSDSGKEARSSKAQKSEGIWHLTRVEGPSPRQAEQLKGGCGSRGD